MSFLSNLFSKAPAVDYAELVKNGAVIVDVRTKGEFASGHIEGSINIPLDSVRTEVVSLKKKGKPVITCCRSGNRSGMAKSMLQDAGIECYNGGAWDSLSIKLR